VNTEFITIIAVNLGILLVVSWVLGIFIFIGLLKEKSSLEAALQKSRDKLKKQKAATPQVQPESIPTLTQTEEKDFPLSPVYSEQEDESALYLLNTIDNLSNNLRDKEQQLSALSELHNKQQVLIEEQDSSQSLSMDLLANHNESKVLIDKLETDLRNSQAMIESLESKLREGQDKDSRIAILEETEQRLRKRVDTLKDNEKKALLLADGLKKANAKNQRLTTDNNKLKQSIKDLANVSQEQMETIRKINNELDRVSRLELHQRSVINELEDQIKQISKHTGAGSTEELNALEEQLNHVNETLERTIREKEFVESHLMEMDKSLQNAKETEAALERARKEIETLEMYFPEISNEDINVVKAAQETHKPLPQLAVSAEETPELFNIVADNRLFGILQDFWMTLDMPPLQMIAEKNVARPKKLECWVKTSVQNDEFFVTIGANQGLIKTLAKTMFNHTDNTINEKDMKDALGELGNVIAGTLCNELNPDYIVGISEHINCDDIETHLSQVAIASEVLVNASDMPLYINLVKPIDPS
jgi:myosin heavy subunit